MKSLIHLATFAICIYAATALECNVHGNGDDCSGSNSYTKLPSGKITYGFDDGGCYYCSESPTSDDPLVGASLASHCKQMCDADAACVAYTVGRPAVFPANQYFYGDVSNCCLERRQYPTEAYVDASKEQVFAVPYLNNTCQMDASCWSRYEKKKSNVVGRPEFELPIKAVADTFILPGSLSNTNYGSEVVLMVKHASNGMRRISFMQFDSNLLAASRGRKAKLRLYVAYLDRDLSRTISVMRMPDTFILDEESATWHNTPLDIAVFEGQSTLTIVPDEIDEWVEVDVTDLLTDGLMVLSLENNGARSSDNLVGFASRETLYGPRIVFEDYTTAPTPSPSNLCEKVFDDVSYTEEEVQEKLDFIAGGCDYEDDKFARMLMEAHEQCIVEIIAESMSITIVEDPATMHTYVNVAISS